MIRIKFSITVVEPSKVKDCDRSPAGIPGLNTAGGIDVCLYCVLCVVCCQVEIPATGRSLVQRNPTECGVSE